jgi:hypothetical protein
MTQPASTRAGAGAACLLVIGLCIAGGDAAALLPAVRNGAHGSRLCQGCLKKGRHLSLQASRKEEVAWGMKHGSQLGKPVLWGCLAASARSTWAPAGACCPRAPAGLAPAPRRDSHTSYWISELEPVGCAAFSLSLRAKWPPALAGKMPSGSHVARAACPLRRRPAGPAEAMQQTISSSNFTLSWSAE